MRQLSINKSIIKALNYRGVQDIVDDDGKTGGEKRVLYSPVITFKAHVSGAKGSSQVEAFGLDTSYNKTISMSKALFDKLKLNENTVFFIDTKVKFKDGEPLYDYRVYRIAETVNEVMIAIKKVND